MMQRVKEKHKCPVCGLYIFEYKDSYDICPECGWEDCAAQEKDPTDDLGPNSLCLIDYRADYVKNGRPEWLILLDEDTSD